MLFAILNKKMEEVSIKGFTAFCKNNIPLIVTVSFALFFTYGIKLFWSYNIGNDTALFMVDRAGNYVWFAQIGRFGLSLLSKILFIKEFNPYTVFFITFCLIWFFTISWSYIIAVFSGNTGRNNPLIPFALVFMTMPVWVEQFYFLLQSVETALIISLCPYIVYLLFKGILDREKGKIICAFALLVLMFSVYQAIAAMFCCGVFLCFLLFQEQSDYKPKIYWDLCIKLFITFICALFVYFFLNKIIVPLCLDSKNSDYLDYFNLWGKTPVLENIRNVLIYIYIITIGNIPFAQKLITPFTNSEGNEIIQHLANMSKIFGSYLLLPVTLLFVYKFTVSIRKKLPAARQLLSFLAGISIPFSIILLAILGGNVPPLRTSFALPLAFAFMIYYTIKNCKKILSIIVFCLAILTAANQAQISAQLFFSDQMRYNYDVRTAFQLNDLILKAQPEGKKLPVAFVGLHETPLQNNVNFLMGEDVGRSNFSWGIWSRYALNPRALAFMNSLGIFFDGANESQIDQAFIEAINMPSYPDPECVKQMQDYIVVKFSDIFYERMN